FTGEISATMVAEYGSQYVLVGHSERRSLLGENDQMVAAKFVAIQQAGLIPVLCVGETQSERAANQTENVVLRQLDAILAQKTGVQQLKKAVIAYEPVWAIGTGLTATPEQAQAVHALLRNHIA